MKTRYSHCYVQKCLSMHTYKHMNRRTSIIEHNQAILFSMANLICLHIQIFLYHLMKYSLIALYIFLFGLFIWCVPWWDRTFSIEHFPCNYRYILWHQTRSENTHRWRMPSHVFYLLHVAPARVSRISTKNILPYWLEILIFPNSKSHKKMEE